MYECLYHSERVSFFVITNNCHDGVAQNITSSGNSSSQGPGITIQAGSPFSGEVHYAEDITLHMACTRTLIIVTSSFHSYSSKTTLGHHGHGLADSVID